MNTLTAHYQWEDKTVRERAGRNPSCAVCKKMKLLTNTSYPLGCIERLCKKIKIGILIWPSNRQLPYDMGSRKVQKFLKIFHFLRCPQRVKVSEKLEIFIKMAFFHS